MDITIITIIQTPTTNIKLERNAVPNKQCNT